MKNKSLIESADNVLKWLDNTSDDDLFNELEKFGYNEENQEKTSECVCRGNWRNLIKEYEPFFGRTYVHKEKEYKFFGLVCSDDDYYYGMYNKDNGLQLLSCVGTPEGFDFFLKEN